MTLGKDTAMAWKIEEEGRKWIAMKARERDEAIAAKIGGSTAPMSQVIAAIEYDMHHAPRTTQGEMLAKIGFTFNASPADEGEAEAAIRDCADALRCISVHLDVDAALATGATPMRVHAIVSKFLEETVPEIVESSLSLYTEHVKLNMGGEA